MTSIYASNVPPICLRYPRKSVQFARREACTQAPVLDILARRDNPHARPQRRLCLNLGHKLLARLLSAAQGKILLSLAEGLESWLSTEPLRLFLGWITRGLQFTV